LSQLRRSHPQGFEAWRPAGAGADQISARHQPIATLLVSARLTAPLFAVEPTTAGTPASNKGKLTAGSGSSPDAADRNVWIVA
jgi:hypothetical protein